MKIKLTEEDLTIALEFVSKRTNSTTIYKSRGGFKTDDILIGALGEIAAQRYLIELGYEVGAPDFNIYKRGEKSYAADLHDSLGHCFHVKSQGLKSAKLYGNSYLMQKYDCVVTNATDDDIFVPTLVDVDGLEVTFFGILPFKDVVFGECKVPFLNKTKVAIYLDDMEAFSAGRMNE